MLDWNRFEAALRNDPGELAKLYDSAHVPPRYRGHFEEPGSWPSDTRAGGASVADWRGRPPSLLLWSPAPGSGKTRLAVELLKRRILTSKRSARRFDYDGGRFVRCRELVDLTFSDRSEAASIVSDPGVVILDDLGASTSGGSWDVVEAFVAERYDRMLPTIYTMNLNLKQLSEVQPRIADRLTSGLVCQVPGRSRRGFDEFRPVQPHELTPAESRFLAVRRAEDSLANPHYDSRDAVRSIRALEDAGATIEEINAAVERIERERDESRATANAEYRAAEEARKVERERGAAEAERLAEEDAANPERVRAIIIHNRHRLPSEAVADAEDRLAAVAEIEDHAERATLLLDLRRDLAGKATPAALSATG